MNLATIYWFVFGMSNDNHQRGYSDKLFGTMVMSSKINWLEAERVKAYL
jgi:hypothetical protein